MVIHFAMFSRENVIENSVCLLNFFLCCGIGVLICFHDFFLFTLLMDYAHFYDWLEVPQIISSLKILVEWIVVFHYRPKKKKKRMVLHSVHLKQNIIGNCTWWDTVFCCSHPESFHQRQQSMLI